MQGFNEGQVSQDRTLWVMTAARSALRHHRFLRASELEYNGAPNALAKLAECIGQRQGFASSVHREAPEQVREGADVARDKTAQEGNPEDHHDGSVSAAAVPSERGECTGQIAAALHPRLRLTARLHLEVPRISHWCLFVLGGDLVQDPDLVR